MGDEVDAPSKMLAHSDQNRCHLGRRCIVIPTYLLRPPPEVELQASLFHQVYQSVLANQAGDTRRRAGLGIQEGR